MYTYREAKNIMTIKSSSIILPARTLRQLATCLFFYNTLCSGIGSWKEYLDSTFYYFPVKSETVELQALSSPPSQTAVGSFGFTHIRGALLKPHRIFRLEAVSRQRKLFIRERLQNKKLGQRGWQKLSLLMIQAQNSWDYCGTAFFLQMDRKEERDSACKQKIFG